MVYWKHHFLGTYIFSFFVFFVLALPTNANVLLGVENVLDNHLGLIQGKKLGIVANHTSITSKKQPIIDVLAQHARIVALFGPEHGFTGKTAAGGSVKDKVRAGMKIFSLYGDYRTPTPNMLKDVEMLVYDIQDVGVKFYTYISTLYLSLHAASREGIPILVLDRPNPIGGTRVDGPVTNPVYCSFVGPMPLPIRYGMTVGELASMMNKEPLLGFAPRADLTVVEMKHYKRTMTYAETGLPWVATSPNMPSVETALLYPGICLLEGTNLSEGRGTHTPFLTVGAPYIDAKKWLAALPKNVKNGVQITAVTFTPRQIKGKAEHPKYKNQKCHGLQFHVTDAKKLKPLALGVALLSSAQKLYPNTFTMRSFIDRLWGNEDLRAMIEEGKPAKHILETTKDDVFHFRKIRESYLR
ncbi:DUF1343 domain-containing protein, partial [bacterium]|nr:DUF1343 domain-containing protein [bacterium]